MWIKPPFRAGNAAGYVQALAVAGYIGIAPIRYHLAGANRERAVKKGSDTVLAALDFLKSRPDVDASRIGAVGFSEGGLVTLWAAISGARLNIMVLMSPAVFYEAGNRSLMGASSKTQLQGLAMPILLTVGNKDIESIRQIMNEDLVPNLKSLGKTFTYKSDYPGNHKWFWKVRPDHFEDVKAFLARHMN